MKLVSINHAEIEYIGGNNIKEKVTAPII